MDWLGLMLAAALGGASGYGLGLRAAPQPRRGPLLERLERQDKRISELELCLRAVSAEEPVDPVRVDNLEQQARENREHTVGLTRDTLALGTEIKERLQALEDELDARFNAVSERQDEVLEALEQQLTAMQSFIVQAAEEAQQRRQALERQNNLGAAVMAAGGGTPESNAETARILALQAEAQREFIRRRRAAAGIPAPNGQGAGL